MTDYRPALIVTLVVAMSAGRLAAQCPDGTPPPCRSAAAVARPAAPPSPLSIAVLPFENRSPDTADVYLADGVTEEVGNRLTQLGRLQVKARGLVSAQVHRTPDPFDAARRLGVAWFVHGNVRHVSGQLLVNVELVRATTGEEAWASRFPRRDNDVFAVQAEVAESVAVVVGGRLTPSEHAIIARRPTRDNEAYRLYLYGNSLLARRTKDEVAEALEAYTHAVALDPGFAAAWARIGMARGVQRSWGWDVGLSIDSLVALALDGARHALALDSTAAESWMTMGFAQELSGRVYESRASYERAVRLDSTNAELFHLYATLYGVSCPSGTCLGIDGAGMTLFRRALSLDPTLRNSWRQVAALDCAANRLALAEAHLDTALSFGPWRPAFIDRAHVRMLRRDFAGAHRDLEQASAITVGASSTPVEGPLALLAAFEGDTGAARARMNQLLASASPDASDLFELAQLHMALGHPAEAIAALQRMRRLPELQALCAPRTPCSANLTTWEFIHDAIFAPLAGDPRFDSLSAEVRPRIPWLQENR